MDRSATARVSLSGLNEEGSGHFLVPPGRFPEGWRSVDAAEGDAVWGRGDTGSNHDNRQPVAKRGTLSKAPPAAAARPGTSRPWWMACHAPSRDERFFRNACQPRPVHLVLTPVDLRCCGYTQPAMETSLRDCELTAAGNFCGTQIWHHPPPTVAASDRSVERLRTPV